VGLLFSTESGHTRPSSREPVGNFNQKLSIAQARTCCNNNNNRNGSFVESRVSKTGRKGTFGCYFSYSNSTSDKHTIKHLPPLPLVQTTTFVRVGEVTNRKREKKINSKRPRERERVDRKRSRKKRDGHAVAVESNTGNTISLPTGSMDCVHRSLQRIRLSKSIQSTTTFRQNRHK